METFKCPDGCCTLKIKHYITPNNLFDENRRHRRKAGVFIYDPKNDKVLIVQSRGHLWGLPKGTLKYGESERLCAVREVKEETGLNVSEDDFTKAVKIHNIAIYFYLEMDECNVCVQDDVFNNDANGVGWIKPHCLYKCVNNGNISLSQHCRIVFSRLKSIYFPTPSFVLVEKKR